LPVSADRRMRSPSGATKSTHQTGPRLRNDINPPERLLSLAALAVSEDTTSARTQRDRSQEKSSAGRSSLRE
jgi:hypothetical protein